MAVNETIDMRAINKPKDGKISIFKKHENLTLAINSAKVIAHLYIHIFIHGRKSDN